MLSLHVFIFVCMHYFLLTINFLPCSYLQIWCILQGESYKISSAKDVNHKTEKNPEGNGYAAVVRRAHAE